MRAYKDDAAAQYELGLMYLEDDEATDAASPEDEWLLDAEDMRQKAHATSDPQDIKTIRKQARKMYKAYREEQKKKTQAASLVQHTTTDALDDVFGSIVEPLLNGSKKMSPLDESFVAPSDPMELMRQNNAKGVEWLRRAADAGYTTLSTNTPSHVGLLFAGTATPTFASGTSAWSTTRRLRTRVLRGTRSSLPAKIRTRMRSTTSGYSTTTVAPTRCLRFPRTPSARWATL